ncbi:MAG TPA: hypothetical protein VGY48_12860, partial [Vicinamibacterales bacterium]|nr:hypothetical protein [Vicinamibacterales bacterium]
MLRNPGGEVHVLALAGADEAPEDAGVVLDDRAKQAYRRRVQDLGAGLFPFAEQSRRLHDTGELPHVRRPQVALKQSHDRRRNGLSWQIGPRGGGASACRACWDMPFRARAAYFVRRGLRPRD